MIDSDGFRANVGIVLTNAKGKVFWARRAGMDAWQFPQGGIKEDESPEVAMYRELEEEVGLLPEHVEILMSTDDWLKYWLPKQYIRHHLTPIVIGQKQIWYLLKLLVDEDKVDLQATSNPEFDLWKWVDYRHSIDEVVSFKRNVYQQALRHFAPWFPHL